MIMVSNSSSSEEKLNTEVKLICFVSLIKSYQKFNQVTDIPVKEVKKLFCDSAEIFRKDEFDMLLKLAIASGKIEGGIII